MDTSPPSMQPARYQYFEEPNPGILRCVGTGQRVLDVGCGFGALGEELRKRGNYVVGCDIEKTAIDKAATRLDEAYVCDVTDPAPLPIDDQEPFDLIVFGDILEHLYDPLSALARFRRCLAPNGRILVSLPNVASWPIRLGLLFGRFEYSDTGILDRSHIRFFTKGSALRLVRKAGFRVEGVSVTPNFARAMLRFVRKAYLGSDDAPRDPQAIVKSKSYQRYIRWVYPVEAAVARAWGGMFAFQFIIRAVPEDRA